MTPTRQVFRAALFDFNDNPLRAGKHAYRYLEDGLLWIEDGRVVACGDYAEIGPGLPPGVDILDYRPALVLPGFIDSHVHFAQADIVASHAAGLLAWLQSYTYPAEARLADPAVAMESAEFFVNQMLANGTTTAMVFATMHPQSVDAIFNAAAQRHLCLIAGKVLMDRHAPPELCDTAQIGYEASAMLIDRWHGRDRLYYAVTPRFAPTSSPEQLTLARKLLDEHSGVYLQSHVAENRGEVDWVSELFPWSRSYLDVYDQHGLLGERSLYAHCIHLDNADRQRLAQSGTAVAFCPGANLFLGSGLLDLPAFTELDIALSLGTDVGAGTSLCQLASMRDAYKVGVLQGFNPGPLYYFYLATLGAARALGLDHRLGSFAPGRDADFIVVDMASTALMQRRMQRADSIEERLFALMMLGDDRNIVATHILGECQYLRTVPSPMDFA